MQFHDTRKDPTAPLTLAIQRLLGAVIPGAAAMEAAKPQANGASITIADFDPKSGLSVPHLQLNFEPKFLDEHARFWWGNHFHVKLRSELLENTEWTRWAWGVWEE